MIAKEPPPAILREMGRLIGQALHDDGVTQTEFANAVGVSQKHLSNVINGKASAKVGTLEAWADKLSRRFSVGLQLPAGVR